MITSIQFKNFRVLRDATLPLGPFTLIIGPNGSGKSTALRGIEFFTSDKPFVESNFSISNVRPRGYKIQIEILWNIEDASFFSSRSWELAPNVEMIHTEIEYKQQNGFIDENRMKWEVMMSLRRFRIFSFDADSIAAPVKLAPQMGLASNGAGLAGVLDQLRDDDPDQFDALTAELGRWLPEFDRILFETPEPGSRAFLLRTRNGRHRIRAADLSHGTLLALAFLTVAYVPSPPSAFTMPPPIVCFEEPERGIHPRLLREIQDSMYRLAYPESYSEQRQPVQVIATTHSPYLLDLYKDHPEEIVIAQKDEGGARFERLSDKPNIDEFLQDASLGDVWYSGVLGGVPNTP